MTFSNFGSALLFVSSSGIDIAAEQVMSVSRETQPNINSVKSTAANLPSGSHLGLSGYSAEQIKKEKINSWQYQVPVQADRREPPSPVAAPTGDQPV